MDDKDLVDKFEEQKLKLIDLIDQEIIDSKVKLKLLQFQLEAYQCSKRLKNKKQDKSIQVSSFENIAVQVDQNELNKENYNCHCNQRKNQSTVFKTNASNQDYLKKNYVNREKQYFDKVKKITNAVQKSEQCTETIPVLKQNLFNKTNQSKMLRSIAVETTFSDDLNLSILDQTIYLNLPNQINVRKQKIGKIEQVCASSNPIQSNQTFTIEENSLEDCIQRFNEENQVISKSFFENQFDISSRSSTPKKQSMTKDNSEKELPPIELEKIINFPTIDCQNEKDISLESFERTNNLSALTTFNVTALDHQQFWKEIFEKVGLVKI